MKKKELLVFAYDFPPSTGGIAKLCYEIALRGNQFYEKVSVLTRGSSNARAIENKGITIVELPLSRPKCELAAYSYLRKRRKEDLDVLCGLWHPEAMICHMAGIKRWFILAHGGELQAGASALRTSFWLPFYGRFVMNRATKIIANSRFTKELVSRIAPKSAAEVVTLGVDTKWFHPKANSVSNQYFTLLTVSRIQKHKGHLAVLTTLATLPDSVRSKLRWKIAGTGPYQDHLTAEIERLELADVVRLLGFVPDEELPDLYSSSNVFILFSQQDKNSNNIEGFGLVFLEAQACGTPVIGARSGGIPDAVIQGRGGWLLEQDDLEGLSNLLKRLIDNPEEVKTQGEMGRKRVEEEATWEQYMVNLMKAIS